MAGKLEGFSPEQIHEMWSKPGVEGWLEFLQEKAPNKQWENRGTSLKGLCPWHQDSNPSLEFRPENQSIRCYVCNKYTRDLLPFVAEVTNSAVDELYYELAQRFKFKTSPEVESQLRYETVIAKLKSEFVRICTNALSEAAHGNPDYQYGSNAVQYLKSRGIDLQYLFEYGLGLFPTKHQAFEQMPQQLRADFEPYFGSWFNANPNVTGRYGGWIVMPFYTSTSKVGRIKIRPPNREDHPIWIGGEKSERRGFFGLNMFRTILDSNAGAHSGRVVIVEGEMDQLSFHQEQLRHHGGDLIPIVAGSGGSAEDIGMLKRSGAKHVTLMGDHDKGGVAFVKKLLGEASQDKLHRISVFNWGQRYQPGTDPDDLMQAGHYQRFRAEVLDPAYLHEPHEWATERVAEDFGTMVEKTVKARVELASKYSEVLKSEIDFDLFQQASSQILGLKPSLLEKHTTDIEAPEGYIRAIERALLRVFKPLLLRKTNVEMYRIREERPQTIPFSPNRAWRSTIEVCLGQTTYDWVESNIGIPDHVAIRMTKGGPQQVPMEQRMKKVESYFDWAFDRLKAKARPVDELETKRQGYHFVAEDDALADMELPEGEPLQRHYLVNGNKIFIGHEVEGRIKWHQAKSPIHGGFYFETQAIDKWSKYLTVPNLEDTPLASPADMYHKVRDPIQSGFRFVDGDIQSQALAYYIMAASALTSFPSMTQLFYLVAAEVPANLHVGDV
jgi:DNA primase